MLLIFFLQVIFGRACAKTIAEDSKPGDAIGPLSDNAGEASVANIDKLRYADGGVNTSEIRLKMQKTMQTHAAVFRTGPVMKEGIEKMNALWKDMANIKLSDRGMIWNRLVKTLQNKICFVTMALNSVNWDVKSIKILLKTISHGKSDRLAHK